CCVFSILFILYYFLFKIVSFLLSPNLYFYSYYAKMRKKEVKYSYISRILICFICFPVEGADSQYSTIKLKKGQKKSKAIICFAYRGSKTIATPNAYSIKVYRLYFIFLPQKLPQLVKID